MKFWTTFNIVGIAIMALNIGIAIEGILTGRMCQVFINGGLALVMFALLVKDYLKSE